MVKFLEFGFYLCCLWMAFSFVLWDFSFFQNFGSHSWFTRLLFGFCVMFLAAITFMDDGRPL